MGADCGQAANERSILMMTQDRDFGELAFKRGWPVTGMVLFELERIRLAKQVERIAECLTGDLTEFGGHLTVIEPARLRRRALPGARAA